MSDDRFLNSYHNASTPPGYGFIQASDRLEGDFTEQDEANLARLATLTSAALDALARLHLPQYQKNATT